MTLNGQRLLIVGNPDQIHIGSHFHKAAQAMAVPLEFCDSREAYDAQRLVAKFNWHLRGRRPTKLQGFSRQVVEKCVQFAPQVLLTTGISPLAEWALVKIGEMGIFRLNFLTDDPWNPAHCAAWFLRALPHYDQVYSPRQANLNDLRQLGCLRVSWLPFAYAPDLHYPENVTSENESAHYAADVVFAGGADAARVGYLDVLMRAGFNVALYGGYWNRFSETRRNWRGHADPTTLRKAIGAASVALCMVRHDNRDGHSMRSFELPAIGACLLAEDTVEHRQIFGQDRQNVVYFSEGKQLVEKVRWLLEHQVERERLAQSARQTIVQGENTYADRLAQMLAAIE